MAGLKNGSDTKKPLTVAGFRQKRLSDIAVYVTLICKDENGNHFEFDTSRFNFDMTPVDNKES